MKTWLEFMPRGGFGHSRLIFYFWFAKLTIIKYLTPLTSTWALGLSSGFAHPRFESSDQNKKLGTRPSFLFRVTNKSSPSLGIFATPARCFLWSENIAPPHKSEKEQSSLLFLGSRFCAPGGNRNLQFQYPNCPSPIFV